MECKFSDVSREMVVEVKINTHVISNKGSFKYLDSIVQGNREIDDDIVLERGG